MKSGGTLISGNEPFHINGGEWIINGVCHNLGPSNRQEDGIACKTAAVFVTTQLAILLNFIFEQEIPMKLKLDDKKDNLFQ